MRVPNTIQLAKLWILVCGYLNIAGWTLSALGCLDLIGYTIASGGGILGLWLILKNGDTSLGVVSLAKLRRRFSHFFPAFFLLLCLLAVLGGILYVPNNYDALTYRFPRILHWLAEHRWHWIIPNSRMNTSATGIEWLMAPLFVFAKSDRGFFLINIVSYALLPGLTYATFIRMGIAKRVAWYWMWLLPSGCCFVSQAGSIGNDSFAAVYFLSAIYFTLRAQVSRQASDLWIGALAAALLTAAKASNIPLLLPWLLAAIPALGVLFRQSILATAGLSCLILSASFLPIAVANIYYAGKWTGDSNNTTKLQIDKPQYAILGNGLQLISRNTMPPVMPLAKLWNQQMDSFIKTPIGQNLRSNFPRLDLRWFELESEESAGLGLGLSALLGISIIANRRRNPLTRLRATSGSSVKIGTWIGAGSWIALLAFMAKMGSESSARLIAAYYPAIIASILLLPGMALLTRKRWWKLCAVLAALSALPIIILNPSRPLWPAMTLCKKVAAALPENPLAARALTVYSVYRDRADSMAPLRKYLSDEDKIVGFIGADDSEVSLWRPFGHRRVLELDPSNLSLFSSNQFLIFARPEGVKAHFKQSMEEWLKVTRAHVVGKEKLFQKASQGEREWYVVKLEKTTSQLQHSDEYVHDSE